MPCGAWCNVGQRHRAGGAAALVPGFGAFASALAQSSPPGPQADYTLRIARGNVELSPTHGVSTTLYNGQFPGPLLRFTEGKRAIEEGTPAIAPHGMQRIIFIPKPTGFRFLHTHVIAGGYA